jgi:glycosyltransferase involved in cell wall biosynthesis
MISFVWSSDVPMLAGTGGSETFTAGQVRELLRRGIRAQIINVKSAKSVSRKDFHDLPIIRLSQDDISSLPGRVVFVNGFFPVATINKSAIFFHTVTYKLTNQKLLQKTVKDKILITNSKYNARSWSEYLNLKRGKIKVVEPFACPEFGKVKRTKPRDTTRVLFAGRLHPEKGIFTILQLFEQMNLADNTFQFNVVAAGQHERIGKIITQIFKDIPEIHLIQPKKSVGEMAKLLAGSDILIMPSVYEEPFGMLSVEAQHAGCRVVASRIGGLPETNCGLVTFIKPNSSKDLIRGIELAAAKGPTTAKERFLAKQKYTLHESVDKLLIALEYGSLPDDNS